MVLRTGRIRAGTSRGDVRPALRTCLPLVLKLHLPSLLCRRPGHRGKGHIDWSTINILASPRLAPPPTMYNQAEPRTLAGQQLIHIQSRT